MDWAATFLGIYIAGIIIAIEGIVKLISRRFKKLPEGATELISGGIVALIAIMLMISFIGQVILTK
jgi:hypothetical protein